MSVGSVIASLTLVKYFIPATRNLNIGSMCNAYIVLVITSQLCEVC